MFPIDFCHIPVSIIKRSEGRSAVAAAAYRSGTKLTNEWDGLTHDYTRKGGIVHAEIMLPAHAPPEFADRSTLWNSVEQIEKARDSQLAREIEAALPRELSREQQLALVRAYVKENFVDKGMCADFAIHDKGTGNPHVHIMLTVRQVPHHFFRKEAQKCGQILPAEGDYGVAMLFFPQDDKGVEDARRVFEEGCAEAGVPLLFWREFPMYKNHRRTDPSCWGSLHQDCKSPKKKHRQQVELNYISFSYCYFLES